ncbi:hypothetical protein [Pseudanabaena sp. ABRG5-3]|uniref:hypothetical protein n=1 Tax=Pseudanabaena sp. ABRG5-3 TaxID=685565 RepID=UPI000DC71139|nr:hypothetical protein [Pseudanabaena sp. ABRG5-3]BBC26534.1 hypothetical protein ABRG53_4277 [Pseudanabaena sp. ABRG5-3]
MCIFSREIQEVKDTKIFARLSGKGTQYLVYSMSFAVKQEVAMILPLPIALEANESPIHFISLESYPEFFSHMITELKLARPQNKNMSRSISVLEVHQVGSYEASFVPRLADFIRLDERFQLPTNIWDSLPKYKDYGFAVFQLRGNLGNKTISFHPMAFEFATRFPDHLFFSTLHVHDRLVHHRAEFDHYLFYQNDFDQYQQKGAPLLWLDEENVDHSSVEYAHGSNFPAGTFIHVEKTSGIVDGSKPCRGIRLYGMFPNQDITFTA